MKSFLPLGFPLLSASAVRRLELYVRRHPEKATEHISSVSKSYDGLCHFWPGIAVIAPEIQALARRFTIPVSPFFSYIRERTELKPHVDGEAGGRKTSIIQPIFPLHEYAPLILWEHGTPRALELFEYPAIIDLQTPHSVHNDTDSIRFNFQLSIDLPFAEVRDLHVAGKLVRPVQACS